MTPDPSLMTWATIIGVALALVLVAAAALGRVARHREHWLIACLCSGGLYVALSLKLTGTTPAATLIGVRWGLFVLVGYSYLRYRRARQISEDA